MTAERDEHFGLTASVIGMIRSVFAHYPSVTDVRVYGSRAKGDYKAGSDIDLSIMDEDVSSAQLMQIETAFDELPTLYSIDLSLFHQIDNPALTDHILRIGKVFYRSSAIARQARRCNAWVRSVPFPTARTILNAAHSFGGRHAGLYVRITQALSSQ